MINSKYQECLYDWMFHFNPYTGLWSALLREDNCRYFNDPDNPELTVIKSSDIKALLRILHSIECDPNRIADL